MSETARSPGEPGGKFVAKSKEIRDHRDLRVWRKARKLAALCAAAIAGFTGPHANPGKAIQRLAEEVAEEIAAGQSTGQHAAYMDHLQRARGALRHLERRLIEAYKEGALSSECGDPLLARLAEIDRMLRKLMLSLELAYWGRAGKRTS